MPKEIDGEIPGRFSRLIPKEFLEDPEESLDESLDKSLEEMVVSVVHKILYIRHPVVTKFVILNCVV